jgi:tRNA(fMet)-specific endonuclease VapC
LAAVILDTNAISAMAEGDTALEKVLPEVASQFIPVICLGEYRAGVIQSKARKELERWLAMVEQSRGVLRVEVNTAHFYAGIIVDLRMRGRMIPINDVWIAALALQHDLPVLSRDSHFDEVKNVRRVSW